MRMTAMRRMATIRSKREVNRCIIFLVMMTRRRRMLMMMKLC